MWPLAFRCVPQARQIPAAADHQAWMETALRAEALSGMYTVVAPCTAIGQGYLAVATKQGQFN